MNAWYRYSEEKKVIDLTVTEEELKMRTFYAMTFITMGASANTYIDIPNYELLMKEFGVTTFLLGLMTGVFLIAYGLSSILWAFLNEKLGRRRGLLTTALIISSMLTFILLFSQDFMTLFLLRAVSGVFLGAIAPIVYSILIDLFKAKERIRALYRWSFLSSVGSGIGFGLSSVLAGFYGWRGAFSVGFVMILIGTILSFKIIEPPRGMSEEEIEDIIRSGKTYPYRISLKELKALPKDKFLKVFLSHALLTAITWGAFGTWAIHMLSWEVGLSNTQALLILGIISTGAIFSIPLARLLDVIRIRKPRYVPSIIGFIIFLESSLFIAFLIMIPIYSYETKDALAVINWITQDPMMREAILLGLIAMALSNIKGPMLQAVVADSYLPEYRATIMAVVNIAYLIGRSVGIIIAGMLAVLVGTIRFSIIISELFLVGASMAWFSISRDYVIRVAEIKLLLEKRAKRILLRK